MKNGVLLYQKDTQDADADVTWTTKRADCCLLFRKTRRMLLALIQQEGDRDLPDTIDGCGYCYLRV